MVRGPWFRQRTIRVPTWRFWLVSMLLMGGLGLWVLLHLHNWLCPIRPVPDAKYVAIEGWCPDRVVWAAVQWSKAHDTSRIFTTGIPIERGMFSERDINYADICAHNAVLMGADRAKLRPAPAPVVRRERTRAMAAGLDTALRAEDVPLAERKINVFTLGAHAWRTQHLMAETLGPTWQVGIISVPNTAYAAPDWWKSSEGAKSVITELVAIVSQCFGSE